MAASKMASPALTQPPLLDEPKRSALVAAQPEAALAKQHSRAGVQSPLSDTAPRQSLLYRALQAIYERLSRFLALPMKHSAASPCTHPANAPQNRGPQFRLVSGQPAD